MRGTRWLVGLLFLVGCDAGRQDGETLPVQEDVAHVPAHMLAVLRDRVAACNAQDWDRWEALHTPDAQRHAPELKEPLHGAPAMRAAIERLAFAFPDYRLTLVRAVGQGNLVAAEFLAQGTMEHALQTGDGSWIPATHQSFTQRWMAMVRLDGDRIAEIWEYYDQQELNEELVLRSQP